MCGCVGWLGFLAGYILVQVVKLAHKRLDDRFGLTGRRLYDSHKVCGWQAKAQDALDERTHDLEMKERLECFGKVDAAQAQQLRPQLLFRGTCLLQLGAFPCKESLVPHKFADMKFVLTRFLHKLLLHLLEERHVVQDIVFVLRQLR